MDASNNCNSLDVWDERDVWLKSVTNLFKDMSLENKMRVLNVLLDNTTPEERYCLMELLSKYLRRDIFISLPTEIQEHICHFIDAQSLLVACSVSKEWNTIISSLSEVWYRKYKTISLGSKLKDSENCKRTCIKALKFMEDIRNGSIFQHHNISASLVSLDQITALHYCKGILIGCADYQVGVWHAKDFELLVVFQVPYRISCVHVYKSCLLAVGHNNGCLTTWSLSLTDGCTGLFRHEYRSHTGVVMSVNVNCDIDLMISGATDFTAKLWSISSGSLLKTLVPHSHWVVQVTLLPTLENDNSKTQFSGVHSLLTMTRDHIRIYSWNVHSEGKEKYGDVSTIDKSVIELPLNSVHKFFTPGCHVVDGNAVYVKQTLIKDEHGDAEIVFQNLVTQKVSRRVQLKQKVRKLLAVGEKFALLLLPHSHYSKLNLLVIELSTGNVIGGCHLPHSSSSTPDLSQVTLGEVDWLKDLSMHKPDDIVIALGLPRGQVRAVTWRSLKEGTTG